MNKLHPISVCWFLVVHTTQCVHQPLHSLCVKHDGRPCLCCGQRLNSVRHAQAGLDQQSAHPSCLTAEQVSAAHQSWLASAHAGLDLQSAHPS